MKIAVIGTAGRNEDGQKLSKEKFFEMVALVSKLKDAKEATLVSGGAAWADHIAVVVFLLGNCKSLSLHLPCAWDVLREQYADTGEFDWRTNPGGTANHYHHRFAKKLGYDENYTLRQIHQATLKEAMIHTGAGFHDRNSAVASEADMLFAFTFGDGARVADGGTRDTFEKYIKLGKKAAYHFNLNEMKLYSAE